MKVLRSSLLVAAAVVTAACGDKVTVAGPAAAGVTSITVTPGTATLNLNQSITLVAAVNMSDASAPPAATWSTSDASKVSVTQAGVIVGVAATPGVAICAAAGGKTGCAQIVVSGATAVIPATVSIQSISINGAFGGNTPVNPGAVAGVIDVRVNVSPGNETVSKVVVLVGTVRADSQTFTAAQSAALRSAADEAVATQSAFPPVLFSINTAKFNATTGAVAYPNGPYAISVQLFVVGTTAARATATYQTSLTFANVDTYIAAVALTGGFTGVLNATGFKYDRGGLAVTVTPVSYTGRVVTGGTVTFGSGLCGSAAASLPLVAPTAPATFPYTATFLNTGTAAGNLTAYEFAAGTVGCTLNAIGETIAVTGTDQNGDALFSLAAPVNVSAITNLRLDNKGPGVPTLVQNPNNRQNGWINAAVAMTGANASATSNGWMVNGAADVGVGGYVRMVRIAAPGAGNIIDLARAATASNTPTLPAPSAANVSYCAVFSATDALGNESTLPAAGVVCTAPAAAPNTALAAQHMLFGVDIAPPTIAMSGGMLASSAGCGAAPANCSIGATVGGEFQVTVSDTGVVGNSGMLAGAPVIATVSIRSPTAGLTAAQLCPVGTVTAGVCTQSSTGMAAAVFPLVATATITAQTITGYYTFTANSVDAAGNVSVGQATRVRSMDTGGIIPALTSALFNTPISGTAVTFNANGSDNFDLWKISYRLTYGTLDLDASGTPDSLYFPSTTIQTFNTAPFVKDNVPANITINGFMRQLEVQTNACNVFALAVVAGVKPTNLHENLLDMVNLNSGLISTVIPGSAIPTVVSYTATGSPATQAQTFYVSNGVSATTCANTAIATGISKIGTTVGSPTSVALNADVFGQTAVFNAPFTRVDFYAQVGTSVLEQIGSATTFSTVDDGSTNGRRHRFTFTWTPGATSPITGVAWPSAAAPGTPVRIVAVGVNAAGDGLVSLFNVNVGLVP